jgi:hypothetical protein
MKALALLTLATALWAAPQDKLTLASSPKAGDKTALKVAVSMTMTDGTSIELRSKVACKVASVEGDQIKITSEFVDTAVSMGEQDISSQVSPESITATLKPDGDVVAFTGGLTQADGVRVFLLSRFVPPAGPVAPGDKYKVEFKGDATAAIPARSVDNTYVGVEEVAKTKAYKFTQKYSESTKDGMSSEGTFWVDNAGNVLKVEAKFDRLPIAQLGTIASGTVKGEKAD